MMHYNELKRAWEGCGFTHINVADDFKSMSISEGDYLGDTTIDIDYDGAFSAYIYSNHEGNSPYEFTAETSKLLFESIELLKYVSKEYQKK